MTISSTIVHTTSQKFLFSRILGITPAQPIETSLNLGCSQGCHLARTVRQSNRQGQYEPNDSLPAL